MNARQSGSDAVVSFGGAWSNHLHALAAAGKTLGIATVGIVRGYADQPLTPMLIDAQRWGMNLYFLNQKDYRTKNIAEILPILTKAYSSYTLVPEGGDNLAGMRGCIVIGQAIASTFGTSPYSLCCAAGTGTMLAGLIAGSPLATRCTGISVLKGADELSPKVHDRLALLGRKSEHWSIQTGFDHGGYAKTTPELLNFMTTFEQRNGLLLDQVYTAKLLWAIERLALNDYWPRGSTVIAIHSGGLQGRRGIYE